MKIHFVETCLFLFFVFCIFSCKKDISIILKDEVRSSFDIIIDNYNTKKIYEILNPDEQSPISWEPQWAEKINQKANDSVSYIFVPLRPFLKKDRIRKTVERGGISYLLIKNEKEFYKAFYFNDNDSVIVDISDFNGEMLFKNLQNRKSYLLHYENGSPVLTDSKQPLKMGWEQNCEFRLMNCTWASDGYSCGPWIQIWHSRDCHWPTHCSGFAWILTDSNEEWVCYDVWVPDPPENPGGGGGGEEYESDEYLSEEQKQSLLVNKICSSSFDFEEVVSADVDGMGWKEASVKGLTMNTIADSYFENIWTMVTTGSPIVVSNFNLEIGVRGDRVSSQAALYTAEAANQAMHNILKKYTFNAVKNMMQFGDFPIKFAAEMQLQLQKKYGEARVSRNLSGRTTPKDPITGCQ